MRRMLVALAIAILFPLEGQAAWEMIHAEEWCSEQDSGRTEELLDDGPKWTASLIHTPLSLNTLLNGGKS